MMGVYRENHNFLYSKQHQQQKQTKRQVAPGKHSTTIPDKGALDYF